MKKYIYLWSAYLLIRTENCQQQQNNLNLDNKEQKDKSGQAVFEIGVKQIKFV